MDLQDLFSNHSLVHTHERSHGHETSSLYKESLIRSTTCITVSELVTDSAVVTADKEGFCDDLRCLYFLMKKEVLHTTNFADIQDHCIQLGNDILPRLLELEKSF